MVFRVNKGLFKVTACLFLWSLSLTRHFIAMDLLNND